MKFAFTILFLILVYAGFGQPEKQQAISEAVHLTSHANDSTLLESRIKKIKALASELSTLPKPYFKTAADTTVIIGFYKGLENKYFMPGTEKQEFSQWYGLLSFHYFILSLGMDSLILRYPDPEKDSITNVKNLPDYLANTIILYLPMYDLEWEGGYFAFKQNSDQLLYIIEAGGAPEEYRRKKHFLDSLYRISKN